MNNHPIFWYIHPRCCVAVPSIAHRSSDAYGEASSTLTLADTRLLAVPFRSGLFHCELHHLILVWLSLLVSYDSTALVLLGMLLGLASVSCTSSHRTAQTVLLWLLRLKAQVVWVLILSGSCRCATTCTRSRYMTSSTPMFTLILLIQFFTIAARC